MGPTTMDQLGTDFHATGSVMTPAQLHEYRSKRGECVTCGRKCFQKKVLRMIPITDHGRVLKGRCLNCNPLDSGDASKQADGGIIPAVSRRATREDLLRFTRSQSNLALGGPGLCAAQGMTRGLLRSSMSGPLPASSSSTLNSNTNHSSSANSRDSPLQTTTTAATTTAAQQQQRHAFTRGMSTRSNNSVGSVDSFAGSRATVIDRSPGGNGGNLSSNSTGSGIGRDVTVEARRAPGTRPPVKQSSNGNSSVRSASRESLNSNDESIASHTRPTGSSAAGSSYVIVEESSFHRDSASEGQDYEEDNVVAPRSPGPRHQRPPMVDSAILSPTRSVVDNKNNSNNMALSPNARMMLSRKNAIYPHHHEIDHDETSCPDDDYAESGSIDRREIPSSSYHSCRSRGSCGSRSTPALSMVRHLHSPLNIAKKIVNHHHHHKHHQDDDESFTNTSENYDDYAPLPHFHGPDIINPSGEDIEEAFDRMTVQQASYVSPNYHHPPKMMADQYPLDAIAGVPYDAVSYDRQRSERSLGSSCPSPHNSSNNNSVNIMRLQETSQRSLRSDRSGHNTEEELAAYESRLPKHGILNRGGAVNLSRMTGGGLPNDAGSCGTGTNSLQSSGSDRLGSSSYQDQNGLHHSGPSLGHKQSSNKSLETSVSSFEGDVPTMVERQESMSSFRSQLRTARSNSYRVIDRSISSAASTSSGRQPSEDTHPLGSSSNHSRGNNGGILTALSHGTSFHSCDHGNDSMNISGHSFGAGFMRGGKHFDLYTDPNANSMSTATTYVTSTYGSMQDSQDENISRTEEGLERLSLAGTDYVQIIDILREFAYSEPVLTSCLNEISNLRLTPDDCDMLAEAGGLESIVEAMRLFPEQEELQLCACRALCNISGTAGNQMGLVDEGAADIILECTMATFADSAELQGQAMAALANMAALEENLEYLLKRDIVRRVVHAMNSYGKDVQVQMKGCSVITNLASHPSAMKAKVMMDGGGGAVVLAMVLHAKDPQLQDKGLQALRNLSANCEENKVDLAHIGGIDASIDAMKLHRDDPYVQEAGAWTLCNLAGNMSNKEQIGQSGGIDVIVRAMWVHSDQTSVDEWCVRALFSLSLHPANCRLILEVNGITAVVNAMQGHEKSSVVQEMGCAILCNLAADDRVKTRIVDEEALDAIVLAMVLYGEDVRVQERACQVVLHLAIAPNMTALHASNIVELVRVAAERYPEHCGEAAHQLLETIDHIIPGFNGGAGRIPVK